MEERKKKIKNGKKEAKKIMKKGEQEGLFNGVFRKWLIEIGAPN